MLMTDKGESTQSFSCLYDRTHTPNLTVSVVAFIRPEQNQANQNGVGRVHQPLSLGEEILRVDNCYSNSQFL